jgi:hypothetical protein
MQKTTTIKMKWQLFITDGITTKRTEEERHNRDRFSYSDFITIKASARKQRQTTKKERQ